MKPKPKIKRRPFKRLTAAQKRVAIAKDVLAQIQLNTRIESGRYWRIDNSEVGVIDKTFLTRPHVACSCCAAGAVVLSGIRLFNRVKVSYFNPGQSDKVLNPWFSNEQMALIEFAFEKPDRKPLAELLQDKWKEKEAAYEFNLGRLSMIERAERIFKNIIANKGTFKP